MISNPLYVDDPDFYERPGETVQLTVDQNPARHVVPALPWDTRESMADSAALVRELRAYRLSWTNAPCAICRRKTLTPNGVCDYCARAQARDETAKARANVPQPSRPRISIREGWEVWASAQPAADPEDLGSGHVREYETRVG